jgi:hypothetical protein
MLPVSAGAEKVHDHSIFGFEIRSFGSQILIRDSSLRDLPSEHYRDRDVYRKIQPGVIEL